MKWATDMRTHWYAIEWRPDGGEWSEIARFLHKGSAWEWATEVAKRPATGAIRVYHRGTVVYEPDCYEMQRKVRESQRKLRELDYALAEHVVEGK